MPTHPHLVQILQEVAQDRLIRSLTASGSRLTESFDGYLSDSAPRCCPDVHATATWVWSGHRYASEVHTTLRCSSANLRLGLGSEVGEPTGQHSLDFTLANRSTKPCYLKGYPGVALIDASGHALPFVYHRGGDQVVTSNAPTAVELPPGGPAFFTINKYRCDLGDRQSAGSISVIPPDESSPVSISLATALSGIGYCGPGDPGSLVSISPIAGTSGGTLAGGL